LAGPHQDFKIWNVLFNLFYLLLIIGPVEEMVFRMYYQNTFISFFKKYKWICILVASIIFGLFHIFNGWISVLITFGIGFIFGFAKEYINYIHYPGISFAHGLYDLVLRSITYIF
jgi:membrane protease YdiL (CAAX protease family)